MAERSETHEISGNKNLSAAQRLARTKALYLPFHDRLRGVDCAAFGARASAHPCHRAQLYPHLSRPKARHGIWGESMTKTQGWPQAFLARAKDHLGLITKLNEPYSAADEVTHTLALQATPYAIANVMLEVRNDLIATKAQQADLSARLAPILQDAVYDPDSLTRKPLMSAFLSSHVRFVDRVNQNHRQVCDVSFICDDGGSCFGHRLPNSCIWSLCGASLALFL